jgi:hypothetical protein
MSSQANEPAAGQPRALTPAEAAVLDAVHAYLDARYRAFALAQRGTQREYEERARHVDSLSRAMLAAMMEVGPRHPNDRDNAPRP